MAKCPLLFVVPICWAVSAAAEAEPGSGTALDLHYEPAEQAPVEALRRGALAHLRSPSPGGGSGGDAPGTTAAGRTPALELGWIIPSACDPGILDGAMSWLHEGRAFDCDQRGYALSLGIRNR